MTIIEKMARAMAPHVAGPSFDDLAPDRHEQKRLHREGLVFDINQPTQADLMGAAKESLKALAENVSDEIVEAGYRAGMKAARDAPDDGLAHIVIAQAVVVGALTAALNEGDEK